MENTSITKPGIKITKFWATIIGTILVAGASEFGLSIAPASAIGVAAMIITYVAGRVINKNAQSKIEKNNDTQMAAGISSNYTGSHPDGACLYAWPGTLKAKTNRRNIRAAGNL